MNTPADAQVRRATAIDAAALAKLRYEFRTTSKPAVESAAEFLPRCIAFMERRLGDESRWRVWVLEHGGAIVGNIWLQIIEKLPNPNDDRELHGYVTNFFVRPEHRNGGAGSRMLKTLLDDCERVGIDTVFLWPSDRSRPLYGRHGFKPATAILARDL